MLIGSSIKKVLIFAGEGSPRFGLMVDPKDPKVVLYKRPRAEELLKAGEGSIS
jgi:hypothetical protein